MKKALVTKSNKPDEVKRLGLDSRYWIDFGARGLQPIPVYCCVKHKVESVYLLALPGSVLRPPQNELDSVYCKVCRAERDLEKARQMLTEAEQALSRLRTVSPDTVEVEQ